MTDSFYPVTTMSGNIAQSIVDQLILHGYKVRILTYQYDEQRSRSCKNIDVEYVYNWSFYYEVLLAKRINESTTRKDVFLYKAKKIISNMTRNMSAVGVHKKVVKNINKKLDEMYKKEPFDILLSIAAPFEFQVANYYYSIANKNVRSIIYQVDFWVTLNDIGLPGFLRKYRRNNRNKMMERMSSHSEVIMSPVVYNRERFEGVKTAELPLIRNNTKDLKRSNDEEINVVYAGTLNKKERDPSWIIESLASLNNPKIKMHFYHRGDCGSQIDYYAKRFPDMVINHGTVDGDTASKAIADASILLMIGTPKGDQVAGKTFDYVSTGKPIIYVSKSENDINVEFLNDYQLFESVMEGTNASAVLKRIIQDNSHQVVRFEDLNNKFKDATAKTFYERIIRD